MRKRNITLSIDVENIEFLGTKKNKSWFVNNLISESRVDLINPIAQWEKEGEKIKIEKAKAEAKAELLAAYKKRRAMTQEQRDALSKELAKKRKRSESSDN